MYVNIGLIYACLANYITDACMANCCGRAKVHVLKYWCVLCILRHYVRICSLAG